KLVRYAAFHYQAVVIEQFFARRNSLERNDVHPFSASSFLRFAIGPARMVDPARIVAFVAAIDNFAAGKRKKERVERIIGIDRMQRVGLLGGNTFAAVFDNAGAGGNVAQGKYASAVQGGLFND